MFQNNLLMSAASASGTSLVSVGNSALYVSGNDEKLTRTPGGAGNRDTWTFSCWYYRGNRGEETLFCAGADDNNRTFLRFQGTDNDQIQYAHFDSGGVTDLLQTTQMFRDIGWYHIVLAVDTTQAVEASRVILYINGERVTAFGTANYPAQNVDTDVNNTVVHTIGDTNGSGENADGYMAETVLIDGLQLAPTSFGEFDSTGLLWTPLASATIKALTFGTNGFYLDNATNAQTDASGEGNNWTNNNTVTLSTNTPTNLENRWNPLWYTTGQTLSNGNKSGQVTNSNNQTITSTLTLPSTGKWYIELDCDTETYAILGLLNANGSGGELPFNQASTARGYYQACELYGYYSYDGKLFTEGTGSGGNSASYGTAYDNSDYIGIAADCDNGNLFFSNSGTWQNSATAGEIAAGTGTNAATTNLDNEYVVALFGAGSTEKFTFVDEADWSGTAPTGFKALTTTNIASATTRTASDVTKYFDTILYEGNGAGQRVGQFQPFTDSFTVGNSALFNSANSESLSRTNSGAGTSNKKWTISVWFKRCTLDGTNFLWAARNASNEDRLRFNGSSNTLRLDKAGTEVFETSESLRDTSTWTNVVVNCDTTLSSNRVKCFINGSEATYGTDDRDSTVGLDATWSYLFQADVQWIGRVSGGYYFDGYLAEVVGIDGTALTPSSFGQTDTSTNRWIPKDVSGLSLGTNGYYLDFSNGSDLGEDQTGSNDFTNNNTVTQTTDSPTINVATLDPNANTTSGGSTALSNGNRTSTQSSNGTTYVGGILVPESGKFVWEVTVTNVVEHFYIGIKDIDASNTSSGTLSDDAIMYQNDGTIEVDGTTSSSGPATYTDGDVIRVEWDVNVKIEWFKNDSTQGSYGLSKGPITYKPFFVYNDDTASFTVNFGSSSFTHTPTTGYSALTQDNIASTDQFISALAWIKNRDQADANWVTDRVRGATKALYTNGDAAEGTYIEMVQRFLAGGVQIGDYSQVNTANESFVLWNWMMEATGSGSSNEDGSINTTSTLVDTTLGMSISTYTGTGSNATVGHGLGVVPEMFIVKRIDSANNWMVYHSSLGATKNLVLDNNDSPSTSITRWNNTAPTSSVISIGTTGAVNGSGGTYCCIAFAPSQFISIGSFIANANADGPFIPMINSAGVPIQPVWVLFKNASSSSTNWQLFDTARDPYNPTDQRLFPNDSSAEAGSGAIDIDTGGVKIRNASYDYNSSSGNTITYVAMGTPIIDTDGRIIGGR